MKKFISFILIICVLAFSTHFSVFASPNDLNTDSMETVSEDGIIVDTANFIMKLNTENSLITITDKRNNFVWTSNIIDISDDEVISGVVKTDIRSQLIVEFANKSDIQRVNSYVGAVSDNNVTYKRIKNGIRATYKFESNGFEIPVEYVLTKTGFSAAVVYKDIKETKKNKVVSVSLLPFFGAEQSKNRNGYLFVPDGSGAIISFGDIESGIVNTYEKYVYGDNPLTPNTLESAYSENILVPVYGLKAEDNAFVAVITKGSQDAKIAAGVRGQIADCYNIYSKGIYRDTTFVPVTMQDGSKSESLFVSDKNKKIDVYKVEYTFLIGDNANYTGMAEVYRNYLLSDGLKSTATKKAQLFIDLYGGISKQTNFLGIPYKTVEELTTTDQVIKILKELNKAGVKDISLGLKSFSKDSINGMTEINVSPVSKLGGKSGLKSVIKYCNENNVLAYSYADYFSFVKKGNGIGSNSTKVYSLEKSPAKLYSYSLVDNYRVKSGSKISFIRPSKYDYAVSKLLKSVSKCTLENIALSDISSNLTSDNSADYLSRKETMDLLLKSVKKLGNKVNVITTTSNSYIWKYSKAITDLPLTSSRYSYFTYDVPFLQMILKGIKDFSCKSVNSSGFSQNTFLKCIESGSNIKFAGIYADTSNLYETKFENLYSANYKVWLSKAAEWNSEIVSLYKKTKNCRIIQHYVSNDVSITEYENGVKVYVNYSKTNKDINGVTVESENYVIKEK